MHSLLIFQDVNLLIQALTHRSYVNEHPDVASDNERLEFLGDAILTFLSGEYLYRRYPNIAEDELTRRRAALVDERQLARFALEIGLETQMQLGQGAIRDGGYQNPNLLSSTFEAVLGAYYLDRDRNIEAVRPLVEQLFDSVPADFFSSRANLDPKNRLQEWVQTHIKTALPQYRLEKVGGMDHAPEFVARVYVGDQFYGDGKGRNKKTAEKQAAEAALLKLQAQGLL